MEIRPQSGTQEAFLSTCADVAFIGGAAGGGKTYALELEPLRHIMTVPGFGAVYFRRESPQITAEGGPWDTAVNLYRPLGAKARQSPILDFRFPPYGNTISFSHMQQEVDRYNWDSSQIPLILFDQLESFTRKQFFYLLSRNRSACGIRPYIRGGYNPVPPDDPVGGWLHEFVGWYLDANGEYPDPNKAGIVRWFVNISDSLHWFDSREEATEAYPNIPPLSFTFIPSSVYDNKILLEKDPDYLAKLHGLDYIDQERLLRANHKIKPAAGKVFNREWFPIIDQLPPIARTVRFWDFAATEKKIAKGAATASVKMCMDTSGRYGILDVTEEWLGPAQVDDHMVSITYQDGRAVSQRWEEEGGSSGKRTSYNLVTRLSGYDGQGIRPTGDKLERSRPLAAQALAGNVWLLRAEWNDRFLAHMHNIPDGRFDIHDAAAGAFNEIAVGVMEVF